MRAFALDPTDTLFFRTGRPFNQDDPGMALAETVFPPMPTTVVGAVRAALARSLGWNGGPWTPAIIGQLGDGDDLGPLRFYGPYLVKDGVRLYPAPPFLAGRRQEGDPIFQDLVRLAPGLAIDCDLGKSVRLLQPPAHASRDLKSLGGHWLTPAGMAAVLAGQCPAGSEVLAASDLWRTEVKIGIGRDNAKRTVLQGALYAAPHVRLRRGVRLAVGIEGLPDSLAPLSPASLGGEHRSVWIEEEPGLALALQPPPAPPSSGRAVAILATPAYAEAGWLIPGHRLFSGTGGVVAACVGRTEPVGGWDELSFRPRALEATLPAGTAWFLDDPPPASGAPPRLGKRESWGFGEVLIGQWRDGQ